MTIAVYIDRNGGPEVFERRHHDLAAPESGALRVRHSAIGLNFIDVYFYQFINAQFFLIKYAVS